LDPDHAEDHSAGPAGEHGAVRLAKMPLVDAHDAQRLEQRGGEPRQLGSRVDQDSFQGAPVTRAGGALDLHRDAKRAHFVAHITSSCLAE